MVESDIVVGSFWYRGQNRHPMRVLAVVDGFVVYRYQKYHPGVVSVAEWLSAFKPAGRSSTPVITSRVRRSR